MISVIHNTYTRNQYVGQSAALNIKALEDSGLEYQYIIFNDAGDFDILKDVRHLVKGSKVEYIRSDENYGMGICSGGWVGALPHVRGSYIHNIGQDDVYTSVFYKNLIAKLQDPNIYLAYANGFKTNPNLTITGETLGPIQELDYSQPKEVFNTWFGRQGDTLTSTNNYIPAPGVVYKKELHDIIGLPDLENFKGSADFEYWSRVLYNGLGVSYLPTPTWLYRMSEHSLGSKPEAEEQIKGWNKLILQKYQTWLTQ